MSATGTRPYKGLFQRVASFVVLGCILVCVSSCASKDLVKNGRERSIDRWDTPLTATLGDPARGKAIVSDRRVGMCLLCHSAPFANDPVKDQAQGNIATNLSGVGARWSVGQLRLRIMDSRQVDPNTVMPPYYPLAEMRALERVGAVWKDKPILDAQQVEDVVAFLSTLK
jgi:L-cysteine S-thiosulfotransferase